MDSHSGKKQKAIFLDRDGTVIKDLDYLGDPERIELLPGAIEALRSLRDAGYLLVVITNQSGVARGFFDEQTCIAVYNRFRQILADAGVPLDAAYYCPHLPGAPVAQYDRECNCRKPAPGLFEKAAGELKIDFTISWAVGDSLRDLEPAKKLGIRTILVLTGKGRQQMHEAGADHVADHKASDLLKAARLILHVV